MHKTNFLIGMGIGVAAGSLASMTIGGGKKKAKNAVSKAFHTMGNVADAVTGSMGLN